MLPVSLSIAAPPSNTHFERTWARTDKPVADHLVNRTWMWGPEAFTGAITETFVDSSGGARTVQYFDKSRMEISNLGEDPSSIWYVTNGLLVVEMMEGRIQTGLNSYQPSSQSNLNVAGDADDRLGATYRYFAALRNIAPLPMGTPIHQVVSPGSAGNLFMYNERFLNYDARAAYYVPETNHMVASPFWAFMNSTGLVHEGGVNYGSDLFANPFYATGFPVTEAYWAVVKVGGVPTDVLIQCFQRRCLTYTPSNSSGWQVEAGNVGQHYYSWRYGSSPPSDVGDVQPPKGTTPDTTALPEMILSPMYLNPWVVIHEFLVENGYNPSPRVSPFAAYLEPKAPFLPGTFNLFSSDLGTFNHDTRTFGQWAKYFLESDYTGRQDRFCQQIHLAIYQPDTDVARRLRQFEIRWELDSFGSGWEPYMWYLFGPAFEWSSITASREDAAWIDFEKVLMEYQTRQILGLEQNGFAAYLAGAEYVPFLCR